MTIDEKYKSLQQKLQKLGKVVIAYSGGVDSTFLLKAAVDTIGAENVLACIATGPSLPHSQYEQAIKIAKDIGADVKTVEPNEMEDPKFTINNPDRCYHCKKHLMKLLTEIAKQTGFKNVICGHNLDDEKDFRPGQRAIMQYNIFCPLSDAKLTKNDIRKLSRQLNLPTANIPASPCLASRISYGLPITEQRLKQIEEAEDLLKSLGLVEFRVRHHETIARIEVHQDDLHKITKEPNRSKIIKKIKSLGFEYVTVDLQGFRTGSLNEPLSEKQKKISP